MIEMVMGEGYLASHYFVTASVCALSPLQYAQESADTIIAYARANQPVTVLTAPMTGVSTPISDIGALVAQNAELLAGIVLAATCAARRSRYLRDCHICRRHALRGIHHRFPPFQPY